MKELKNRQFGELKIEELMIDDGKSYDIYMPKNYRDRLVYENGFCVFTPVGYVKIVSGWFPIGFKVVTENLESLGLRNNPTPMKFSVGEWAFEEREMEFGNSDSGGIWTALRRSGVGSIKKHCESTWGMETKAFLTAIYNPVFSNSYRLKSEGVMLLKEIF